MEKPSMTTCKHPRLMQKYLGSMAEEITLLGKEIAMTQDGPVEDPAVTFAVGDSVLVSEGVNKWPGKVTKVLPAGFFDVELDDGEAGCYTAEDFC